MKIIHAQKEVAETMGNYKSNKDWRRKNPDKWRQTKKRYYDKHQYSTERNKIWLDAENRLILSPSRPKDVVLAQKLCRTVRAVQIQRSRLRKEKRSRKKRKS